MSRSHEKAMPFLLVIQVFLNFLLVLEWFWFVFCMVPFI
jgi:hypothetical protein